MGMGGQGKGGIWRGIKLILMIFGKNHMETYYYRNFVILHNYTHIKRGLIVLPYNGRTIPQTDILCYLTVNRKASPCSRWQLTQKLPTNQHSENKILWSAQPKIRNPYHTSPSGLRDLCSKKECWSQRWWITSGNSVFQTLEGRCTWTHSGCDRGTQPAQAPGRQIPAEREKYICNIMTSSGSGHGTW